MSDPANERRASVGDPPAGERLFPAVGPAEFHRGCVDMDSVLMGRRMASAEELLERLCSDQVRRWRAGQRIPAEAYFSLYPAVRDEDEAAFELIYGEFLLREERGEPPPLEEFLTAR